MDSNGTRFHLIKGEADWAACREEIAPGEPARLAYDSRLGALTLRPLLALYRPDRPNVPLTATARRGAAVDQYGNRYWIGADERSIWWCSPRGERPSRYWEWQAPVCPPPSGAFGPVSAPEQMPDRLAGLAVTTHHYLVAGSVERGGLYIFDLHAGPDPLLITVPAAIPFRPFDLAPAPHGGVWALDRANRRYWGFDRHFQPISVAATLTTLTPGATATFYPDGGQPIVYPPLQHPNGFPIGALQPLAIEGLPDGSVLILDAAAGNTAARIWRYRYATLLGPPLPLSGELAFDLGAGIATGQIDIAAHDIAFLPADNGHGTLYAVEDDGYQAMAFDLSYNAETASLRARPDYLPLHAYGGRALVANLTPTPPHILYDLTAGPDRSRDAATRWMELRAIEQPRYTPEASLLLAIPGNDESAAAALDGKELNCQWHRLFIDGCLPPETSVVVQSRAANTHDELELKPFRDEPALYLRAGDPEIPYYRAFANGADPARGRGTWELLLQAARGRFLQLRLILCGNGRVTPQLHAVRVYYPRLSYVRRYLPAVYSDDPSSADFTERLLANHEGVFSEIEGKIALAGSLFDPRSAPPEALDWLANWLGLLFDPIWGQIQQRRSPPERYAQGRIADRRRLYIRFARRLYERRGTPDGIRFALILLLDPCLEHVLERLKLAAMRPDPDLRHELARYDLPYPTPATSERELEDLLYAYALAPQRPAKIRLVERYQTRGGRALAAGDPTPGANEETDLANRFSVLIPEGLDPNEAAMVRRVVDLERPAHAAFDIRPYFDFFRVGEARLGLESVLGAESRFALLTLGRGYLAGGHLPPAAPQDVAQRVIVGRDRAGMLPAL